MDSVAVRLAIDYGTVNTRAALAWDSGETTILTFDGQPALSSGVYCDTDGTLHTGADARMRALVTPDRYVAAPKLHIGTDSLEVAGTSRPAIDLIAATLHRVGTEATRVAGHPVADVRLLVAAGWGPQRRNRLRRAAQQAGLAAVTVVDVAIAACAGETGDTTVLVCDLGSGCETSIVTCATAGTEVIATLHDPDAGSGRLQVLLAARIAALDLDRGDAASPTVLAAARTLAETLTGTPAASLPSAGDGPAIVVTNADLTGLATTIADAVADLATATIAAADLTATDLTAVRCIGAATAHRDFIDALRTRLGIDIPVAPEAATAALRGALYKPGAAIRVLPPPPVARIIGLAIPGAASLALLADTYLTAIPETGYTLITWGELTLAATFALITSLSCATLLAGILPAGGSAERRSPIAHGLIAALAIGYGIIAIYAVTGSISLAPTVAGDVYLSEPLEPFLRWSLLPTVGIGAAALALALLTARTAAPPRTGWHAVLQFPASSVVTASVGMILLETAITGTYGNRLLLDVAGRAGGALIGIGAALALAPTVLWRIILGSPLAAVGAALAGATTTGYLGILYALAATAWWSRRVAGIYTEKTHTRSDQVSTPRQLPQPIE